MKVFEKPNLGGGWKCPICGTNKNKKVVMVGVVGTQEGYNIQAEQIHLECLNLMYDKKWGMIYQKVR